MHPYMIYSAKQNQSIAIWKRRGNAGLSRKLETSLVSEPGKNWLSKWAAGTIWSEWSTAHDPVQIGAEFQAAKKIWFSFAFSDKFCLEQAVIAKLGADLKQFKFGETASHES
jgi:hypothetical protein